MFELPDRFTIDGGKTFINATVGGIDPTTAKNGDWEWDNVNNKIKFIGMMLFLFISNFNLHRSTLF